MDLHLIVEDLEPRRSQNSNAPGVTMANPNPVIHAPPFPSFQWLPFIPVPAGYGHPAGILKPNSTMVAPVGPVCPQIPLQGPTYQNTLCGNLFMPRAVNGTTNSMTQTVGQTQQQNRNQSQTEKIPVLSFTEFRKVSVNSQGDKYGCQRCSRRFTRKSDLMRHIRIHLGIRPNVCSVCSKQFVQRSALTVHMRVHTGEKPYSCQVCGRAFSDSSSLARHKRIHARKITHTIKATVEEEQSQPTILGGGVSNESA